MAEEHTIPGGGGILGVNNLQHAIDTFDRTVTSLQGVVTKLSSARESYHAGAEAASDWRVGMPKPARGNGGQGSSSTSSGPSTTSRPNGGGATFGGGSGNGGGGNGGGGSHRADGPPQGGGLGDLLSRGDGAHRGSGNGVGAALYAAGVAGHALSDFHTATSIPRKEQIQNRYNMLGAAQMMSTGTPMSSSAMAKMYSNSQWALNSQDMTDTLFNNWSHAGSQQGRDSLLTSVKQSTMANPMTSALSASHSIVSMQSATGRANLARVGITTAQQGGVKRSAMDIANQILKEVDPHETVRKESDIAILVNDDNSVLNLSLGNWVANGIISPEQVQLVKDNILTILKARNKGVNATQLQKLMAQAPTNAAAKKKLAGMDIGNTIIHKEKDFEASKRRASVDGLSGFAKGLTDSVEALTEWKNTINDAARATKAATVLGYIQGNGVHGKGTLTRGAGVAHGIEGWLSERFSLGSLSGNQGGGTGGNNENRMSMLAGGGNGTGGGPGAGAGMVSGTPHNVGLASAGGLAVGGGTAAPAGGGKSAKSSGSQKMTWPCRGPITCKFGAVGSHWASHRHSGTDIGVPTGTPIRAAASGTVQVAGWFGPYGIGIEIDHGGGVQTIYGHNSRAVARVGQHVRQGQLIAYSGATGNVTGPHCHFEVRKNRVAVDPMSYLSGGATVPGNAGGGSAVAGSGSAGSALGAGTIDPSLLAALVGGGGGGGGGGISGVAATEMGILQGAAGGGGGGGGGMGTIDPSLLAGLLSGGGASSAPGGGSAGSAGGGGSYPSGPGGKAPKGHSYGGGVDRWRNTVYNVLGMLHQDRSASTIDRVLMQMRSESSGNPTSVNTWDSNAKAGHPSVGLMQVIHGTFDTYAGPFKNKGPKQYGVSTDPTANVYSAVNYAVHRYGSIDNAFHGHGYAKGAWELPRDEVAQVHKGEMIIPAAPARQIRDVLANASTAHKEAADKGVSIVFSENAIQVSMSGGDSGTSTGMAIGKAILDTISTDQRVKNLRKGRVH
jgi:murein DD-endopeptidase MepM/ murein hydrolase activator NlpD/SLT domain-containing protein